ncbi:MAG: 4-hydroxy-tetrahydrodipicolinate synthase [Gammaproteobacteria bacterium]|nr:4-hydroxy-tetrahydrodipicolinate synthase [Gammaproteobacteria bacterium]
MFNGSFVAMITPMNNAGHIDEPALRKLVRWHIDQGTDGLVPVGTTGESPTLSEEEHRLVVRIVVEEAQGKLPVIAGCGSNNTAEAISYHEFAKDVGADAALHVTGYYNRPNQEGIYQHFAALAATNDLPIIVYNVPPRSVVDIEPDTMGKIAALKSVAGVKDATKDLNRPILEGLSIDKPFSFLSGEDGTAVAYNASGGTGCISVTANVAPKLCAHMQKACADGDFSKALTIQRSLMPLHQALFAEPSPSGVKYACSSLSLCENHVRLPLIPVSTATQNTIDTLLTSLSL